MRNLFGLFLLLLLSPASAGLFSSKLSDGDAAGIHKVAVLSCLGDTLYVDSIGLTAFNNKGFQAPVPQWNMDSSITEHVTEMMRLRGRWPAEALNIGFEQLGWHQFGGYSGFSHEGRHRMVEQARAQGADAVLVVCREENPHDSHVKAGFGLYSHSLLGKEHQSLLASYYVMILGVPSDKVLAQQHPDPLVPQKTALPMRASWELYTPEEQAGLESDLRKFIYSGLDQALETMNVLRPPGQ